MEAWNTGVAQISEIKVSEGILMKLQRKYNQESLLFSLYYAA